MTGPTRLPRGARVGPFTILRHLARGGTSDVYAATREGSPAPVALKLLTGLSAAERARAEREAAIAASLDHPCVTRLLEHGSLAPDTVYLAMELLSGATLAQRLDRGALAVPDALAVARQVLDAIHHAHTRGLIHRDIKPANVFLVDDDPARVKVLDFGLARALDGARVTTPGRILGTPAYMSPEQVRSDVTLDARTDLWSTGAVLFEALSGHPPFGLAAPLATLFQVAFSAPRRLDELDLHATSRAALPRTSLPEVRLLSVVLAAGVRDRRLTDRLVVDLDARTLSPVDGLLAVFGLTGWRGDEPQRAVAFARAASLAASSVAVLTTHAITTGDAIPQGFLEDAFRALPPHGVALDATTASLLRGTVATHPVEGRLLLDDAPMDLPRTDASAPFVGRSLERDARRRRRARGRRIDGDRGPRARDPGDGAHAPLRRRPRRAARARRDGGRPPHALRD